MMACKRQQQHLARGDSSINGVHYCSARDVLRKKPQEGSLVENKMCSEPKVSRIENTTSGKIKETIFQGKMSSKWLSLLFSHSVVSDSVWLHELQHAKLPYPSPFHVVYSDSCPLSQWCHSTISSILCMCQNNT